jgi:hypothetical protein
MAGGTIQVTVPASGVVNAASGLPSYISGNIFLQNLQIQNNAANPIRYGRDNSVSVTTPAAVNGGTAGKGILLFPSGAGGVASFINYTSFLSDWWIAGTPGDVIDILFVQ